MKKAIPPFHAANRGNDFDLEDRLLPLAAVMQLSGLGKTMIYQLEREGKFPKRYKPGGVSSRWSEREIMEWKGKLAAQRES